MYSFRNRIILGQPLTGPPDDPSRCVLSDSDNKLVELLGPHVDQPITHAIELRLRGSGYETPESAGAAGRLWRDRMLVAFAHFEMGIDIGSDESPDRPEYSFGQPYFIYQRGRLMRDEPKLTVFPTNTEPGWSGSAGEGVVAQALEYFVANHLTWVRQRDFSLDPQQRLAYNLFHASYFESSPEAAFILLFTGVEALIPSRFRSEPYILALDKLRTHLASRSDIDPAVKDSIKLFLEYQDNQSIRYRGRTWVQLLDPEQFDGKSPEKYFLKAYETRNSLAHGNTTRPSTHDLNNQLRELRRYLLALLDKTVFGELMPARILGFEPKGT